MNGNVIIPIIACTNINLFAFLEISDTDVFSEKLSPENLERIKLYGIYAQDDKQEFFQIKIPLNMGQLNLEQIKIISQIAKDYSDDFINLSSEQRILLKNIVIK